MIHLDNGEINEFCITRDGKRVFVSSNGNWSYMMVDEDELVKFSMKVDNGRISYNVVGNTDSEIDDYTDTLIKYDMSVARKEVEDIKKLTRRMFSKK